MFRVIFWHYFFGDNYSHLYKHWIFPFEWSYFLIGLPPADANPDENNKSESNTYLEQLKLVASLLPSTLDHVSDIMGITL